MPDSFFVVHEGFLQLSLLLKDAGKIGVGCSKLWEHLSNKQVCFLRQYEKRQHIIDYPQM